MEIEKLKPGMMVDYHHDAVEVMRIDPLSEMVEVRRHSDLRHFTASFQDLMEDPQMHTDCKAYY